MAMIRLNSDANKVFLLFYVLRDPINAFLLTLSRRKTLFAASYFLERFDYHSDLIVIVDNKKVFLQLSVEITPIQLLLASCEGCAFFCWEKMPMFW